MQLQKIIESDYTNIVEMRIERKTYQEIANLYGVTRERIRQILKRINENLASRMYAPLKKLIPQYTRICKSCKQEFTFTTSNKRWAKKRKFCSFKCMGESYRKYERNPFPKGTPEHAKFRYDLLKKYEPKRIKQYHETSKKNQKKKLASDPEYKEKFNEYHRQYARYHKEETNARIRLRRATDPEWHEKEKAYQRLRYYKLKELKKNNV